MKTELFDGDFYVSNILLACLVNPGTGSLVHRSRASHGFAYHISGDKTYHFRDGTTVRVGAGDLIYLPQSSDYTVEIHTDGVCYAINFLLFGIRTATPFKVRVKSPKVLSCFQSAERAFRLQRFDYAEICCRELYDIAVYIKENLYDPKYLSAGQQTILTKAEAYISEHCTVESISIGDLSAYCGVSETYLRKLFRAKYSMSPVSYINRSRLSYAHALLLSGEYSVSDACFMSGFGDASYFCRVYRSRYGYPPRQTAKEDEREE